MLSTPSFRKGAIALTTAGLIAASMLAPFSAAAQQLRPTPASTTQGVSESDCKVFGSFILDEARDFKGKLSREFLLSAARFLKSGCKHFDADGEIQIITMNSQDGASLETALRRMGKTDIIALSGVTGCHRPEKGVCPINTSDNTPRTGG